MTDKFVQTRGGGRMPRWALVAGISLVAIALPILISHRELFTVVVGVVSFVLGFGVLFYGRWRGAREGQTGL